MPERAGGCLCKSVRYRLTADPVVSRICWCRDCQHISSNGTVNAIFPSASIEIAGNLSEYTSAGESGNYVSRRFCAQCGSHLFADSTGRAGFTVVRVGTLDDPSSIDPVANIWASSAPTWACLDTSLPSVDKQPQPLQSPPSAA
ncbi:MAG: GFA family protein [Betaproteobacteria bacterium]